MSLFIKRAPASFYMMDQWKESMLRIDNCTNCGHCKENCPYFLDTPRLLQESWADYRELI
jgi:Fe-S oxidoreductase